ncbi:phosphotransferase family protein [Streptomyces hokutonensis]|uniref:Phosphotransferase family protein n=1 Tax=Streptomyces hokutonensis TaxID=1306990 RepID=A0ABW6LTI1_9ACTN
MSSPLHRRAHQSLVRRFAEARRRSPQDGETVSGHHNSNVIMPVGRPLALLLGMPSGEVLAKFRTPLPAIEVVPRLWRHESQVLRVVGERLSEVPKCLADFGDWSLHSYLTGRALADVVREGERIGRRRLSVLADFFARLADIPESVLPPVPADWPGSGDSHGFLGRLAQFTEQRVHQSNRPRFGSLFDAVGIPSDAVDRYRDSVQTLAARPFALLHTDVHRSNVLVTPGRDGENLVVIDWELALYGDPLHDLATHLVRMEYDSKERGVMIGMWASAMRRTGHADMTVELKRDLRTYLGFEYVQSLYPDVMRAALELPDEPARRHVVRAAERVCRALRRASGPLGLGPDRLPQEREVREALLDWHAKDMIRRMEWPDAGEEAERLETPVVGPLVGPVAAGRERWDRARLVERARRSENARSTAAPAHREPTGVGS